MNDRWPDQSQMHAWCRERGVVVAHHCCLAMAYAVSDPVIIEHQGHSRIIDYSSAWGEYRIPVPYDGYESTEIRHCPFCGAMLPASRRDEWYERLYALGYSDPGNQDLPPEFESDAWWRG